MNCVISELQPLRAEPENISLDIVYEDENVLVVNKPAHMVIILHNFKKVETFGIEMLML